MTPPQIEIDATQAEVAPGTSAPDPLTRAAAAFPRSALTSARRNSAPAACRAGIEGSFGPIGDLHPVTAGRRARLIGSSSNVRASCPEYKAVADDVRPVAQPASRSAPIAARARRGRAMTSAGQPASLEGARS
jgi:hypothetical protein